METVKLGRIDFLIKSLDILGADLKEMRSSLLAHESKLLQNDRSTTYKGFVDYYRAQAELARKNLLLTIDAVCKDPSLDTITIMPDFEIEEIPVQTTVTSSEIKLDTPSAGGTDPSKNLVDVVAE